MSTLIETIEARKAEIDTRLDAITDLAEKETRNVTDEEQTEVTSLLEERKSVVEKLATQTELAKDREERSKTRPSTVTTVESVANANRDEVYRSGAKESYFRDLADSRKGNMEAIDRLQRNDKRNAELETRAGTTTVAGAGGEFAPPLWYIDKFVGLARPARPLADAVQNIPLPPDVSSISLPKITTGAATGVQSTQNTQIANQDIVTTSVTTGITTQAGGVVISRQILDQSPISMDEVILGDLARELASKIDLAVITAIAGVSGLNSITYTDGTPTTPKLLPYIQQGIDQVGLGIYTPNTLLGVVRTDRWGRFIAGQDTTNHPLVLSSASYGPFNARGIQTETIAGQGVAGTLNGIPFIMDAQVPNNLGAGTNQDEIFVLDPTQIFLFESTPQAEAFDQTYANTLSVYVRMFEYYGIIANRLPKAISLITGTGLIPYAYGA